jgi:type IV secretory pathway TrbL component
MFPTTQNISTAKEMIRVGNATDAHAQDFLTNDELLLPILKTFAQFTHSLTTRYWKYLTFLVCV